MSLRATAAVSLLLAACAPAPAPTPQGGLSRAEMGALQRYVELRVARARIAWQRRDPSMLVAGPDAGAATRLSDGTVVTNAEVRADLARRMAAVVRLDTLAETITGTRVAGDSVEVASRQRFVRVMREGGRDRVRVSAVTHRQWFRRERGSLVAISPPREYDQEAYWADERPRSAGPR